jgi:hypothetical protein
MAKFRYLVTTETNKNCIHILLSSHILSKNINIKIYKTIILPVVLYGCETWFLILKEEHNLRLFENRVLRRIFGPKREEVVERG